MRLSGDATCILEYILTITALYMQLGIKKDEDTEEEEEEENKDAISSKKVQGTRTNSSHQMIRETRSTSLGS